MQDFWLIIEQLCVIVVLSSVLNGLGQEKLGAGPEPHKSYRLAKRFGEERYYFQDPPHPQFKCVRNPLQV